LAPAVIDYLTSSAFYFPNQTVRLDLLDTEGLPKAQSFVMASGPPRDLEPFRLGLHAGFYDPVHQVPLFFTAFGLALGNNLGRGVWTDRGISSGSYMEQQLGPNKKIYNTSATTIDAGFQYYPWRYFYVSGGLAYVHLTFNKAFNHDGGPHGFSRNTYGVSWGIGASVKVLKFEFRRYIGLQRIDTPVGLDHAVAFGQMRLGIEYHFDLSDLSPF
jgi:hypothetical protein